MTLEVGEHALKVTNLDKVMWPETADQRALTKRDDDQDENAIDKRHSIYYDTDTGTLASAYYFKAVAEKEAATKYITLAGEAPLPDVTAELVSKL